MSLIKSLAVISTVAIGGFALAGCAPAGPAITAPRPRSIQAMDMGMATAAIIPATARSIALMASMAGPMVAGAVVVGAAAVADGMEAADGPDVVQPCRPVAPSPAAPSDTARFNDLNDTKPGAFAGFYFAQTSMNIIRRRNLPDDIAQPA